MDSKNIFKCQRLEIELVRCIVVSGNCLRVAVYDDGLEAELLKSKCSVYAAVVELDALADAVRAAAEDHDLLVV